ncbi:TAXI family TRAP transporter solute-binding subunit [Pseudonocardia sp. GCM10023141]|uniref:TAXI family TRAP transporter solute-binding subunit n=1 Tax=Pseudonocardia sp. GCM10023141 TaxID=3252653 RepID=UPI00360F1E73
MAGGPWDVDRRTVLRGFGVLGLLTALSACTSSFATTRLSIATGYNQGVYFALGTALAQVWQKDLGLADAPAVQQTAGSGQNLQLLISGAADVAFSQVDAAAEQLNHTSAKDPHVPRALARVYDEYVHLVVPRDSPVQTVAQLRGKRVSIGAVDSGVIVVAKRILRAAELSDTADIDTKNLGLPDSAAALKAGTIDAFFWTGGLPTPRIEELAASMPIRLLNLTEVITDMRAAYPEYASGTVPAQMYRNAEAITTVLVRNFLLVGAGMADDLAYALVKALFDEQQQLVAASPSALTIDLRSAISTQPVPLHPGAEKYFRAAKNAHP